MSTAPAKKIHKTKTDSFQLACRENQVIILIHTLSPSEEDVERFFQEYVHIVKCADPTKKLFITYDLRKLNLSLNMNLPFLQRFIKISDEYHDSICACGILTKSKLCKLAIMSLLQLHPTKIPTKACRDTTKVESFFRLQQKTL